VIGFPEREADIDENLLWLRTGIIGNNHPLIQLNGSPGTDSTTG
jgi:hypothetical protein